MKIKFRIVEGKICRIVTISGIECATYYDEDEEYDLDTFVDVIKNAKTFIERYNNNVDVYL